MIQTRPVTYAGGNIEQEIAFCGMQVTAGGICAKRPPYIAGLLPCGQGQGIFQKAGQRGYRHGLYRHNVRALQSIIGRRYGLVIGP